MKVLMLAIAILPSFLKVFVLRHVCNATIGKGVVIGFGTVILSSSIKIGKGTKIGHLSYIHADNLHMGIKAKIGSLSVISAGSLYMGHRSTIASQVTVAGGHDGDGILEMGMYSWIFSHCYVNLTRPVRLGKNVGVGGGTYIFTHGYWLSKIDGFPVSYGEVSIDDNTWLPWGCFIMPGVHIGKNVIVGARSLVTKSVPDNALVAGAPAKIIREKSSADLSITQKCDVFKDLVYEYAKKRMVQVKEIASDGEIAFELEDELTILLHDASSDQVTSDVKGLNPSISIYWNEIPESQMLMEPVWSMANYNSSPEEMFSPAVRRFLEYARTIGLRFYPVDEK